MKKKDIKILDKMMSKEEFLYENYDKDVYILFFNDGYNDINDEAMQTFRKIIDSTANSQQFKNAVFALAKNELINEFSDETNKSTKLCLYKNGKTISDNFTIDENEDRPKEKKENHGIIEKLERKFLAKTIR